MKCMKGMKFFGIFFSRHPSLVTCHLPASERGQPKNLAIYSRAPTMPLAWQAGRDLRQRREDFVRKRVFRRWVAKCTHLWPYIVCGLYSSSVMTYA